MPRTFKRSAALCLAVLAATSLTLSACGKKPLPTTPTPAPAQPAPSPTPSPQPTPSQTPSTAPIPGSQADFVANAGERVYFDLDRHDVRDDARPVLEAQATWLRRYPAVTVRIEGNADERGTREYNLALGARRANAVRDYLVARGVASERISTISYGKEQPIDPGTTEEAYQRNRNARTALVTGAR